MPDIDIGDYELDEDSNGDLVIKDTNDNNILRWDSANATWTFDNNAIEGINSISTEELVIGGTLYEEDDNSPFTVSSQSSYTYTVANSYDEVIIISPAKSGGAFDELQINGDTGSNYSYVDNGDNQTTGATAFAVPSVGTRVSYIQLRDNGFNVRMGLEFMGSDTGQTVGGENGNVGGDGITQFTVSDSGGSSNDWIGVRVFGREM